MQADAQRASAGDPDPGSARTGRIIVAGFAALVAAGAVIAIAYAIQESGRDPVALRFERVEPAPEGMNATELPFRPVHEALFLEDHLDTATHGGASRETVRLRVESMVATLASLTGTHGPEWWVLWDGRLLRIQLDGSL